MKKKGFNISKLATDEDKVSNGVWVDEVEGLRLKIASVSNPAYKEYYRKLWKPHARKLGKIMDKPSRLLNDDNDLAKEITHKAYARFILLDWENLQEPDEKGKLIDVKYSSEKAYEIFSTYPEFFEMVQELATEIELFRVEEQENIEGN